MKTDEIKINDIGSGITLSEDLILALIDFDDQVMALDGSSTILIVAENQTSSRIGGTNIEVVKGGIATFDSLSARADPGSQNINFVVSSQAIDTTKVGNAFGTSISQPNIQMNFRYCKPGEQVLNGECSP